MVGFSLKGSSYMHGFAHACTVHLWQPIHFNGLPNTWKRTKSMTGTTKLHGGHKCSHIYEMSGSAIIIEWQLHESADGSAFPYGAGNRVRLRAFLQCNWCEPVLGLGSNLQNCWKLVHFSMFSMQSQASCVGQPNHFKGRPYGGEVPTPWPKLPITKPCSGAQ